MRKVLPLLFVLELASAISGVTAGEQTKFSSGYAGTLPTDPEELAGTYFDNSHVRSLIHELEGGPVYRQRVLKELEGTGFTPDDLLRVGILRSEDDRFYIGFNYFTAGDMTKVIAAAENHAPSLVQAFLDRRAEFDRLFDRYPVDSVRKDRLASC